MASPRIVMITSDHRRHRWVAARLAQAGSLVGIVAERKPAASPSSTANSDIAVQSYFRARDKAERRYFSDAPDYAALGAPVLRVPWGGANAPEAASFVTDLAPDVIVLFGSCIIKEPLLGQHAGRMINMHLGLSPYYRGSATNFWPLVDGLPECVGVTVHHAILKVDGGAILAQARPDVALGDDAHDLGCKTIIAGADLLVEVLALAAHGLPPGHAQRKGGKLCRRADFAPDALQLMQRNIAEGMIDRYMREKTHRDARYPIEAVLPVC
ncbi:formyl transferase [Pelagibius sp. 7325]|uniref:formyl transferase n=1 Tax=Pelagibius sp. 7325 TaxID=3131994 RepID=UPI0030EBA891